MVDACSRDRSNVLDPLGFNYFPKFCCRRAFPVDFLQRAFFHVGEPILGQTGAIRQPLPLSGMFGAQLVQARLHGVKFASSVFQSLLQPFPGCGGGRKLLSKLRGAVLARPELRTDVFEGL